MTSRENDELTKIDANGKLIIEISEDTELIIIHDPILKCNEGFKNALLASMYSQLEHLNNEIAEKNFLIRTLPI